MTIPWKRIGGWLAKALGDAAKKQLADGLKAKAQ